MESKYKIIAGSQYDPAGATIFWRSLTARYNAQGQRTSGDFLELPPAVAEGLARVLATRQTETVVVVAAEPPYTPPAPLHRLQRLTTSHPNDAEPPLRGRRSDDLYYEE
jgi:hypothetical protein